MIDRNAREKAHVALQRFYRGLITNEQFEDEYPDATKTADQSILAVETMVWNFYGDFECHALSGKHCLDHESAQLVERCLLFLQSEAEYEWPVNRFVFVDSVGPALDTLTLGAVNRYLRKRRQRLDQLLLRAGDFSAWPFLSVGEVDRAARKTRM